MAKLFKTNNLFSQCSWVEFFSNLTIKSEDVQNVFSVNKKCE